MTQQTAFDPEKPIAKTTAEGMPVEIHRTCGDLIEAFVTTSEPRIGSVFFHRETGIADGLSYKCSLQNEPEPQPAVDWEREIQLADGTPLVYLSEIPADSYGNTRVSYHRETELFVRSRDDGTQGGGVSLIINRPVPPKTLRVEIAAATCKDDGREVVFQDNMEAGTLRGIFDNGNITGLFCGSDRRLRAAVHYDVGPWQTIELALPENTAKAKGE